MYCTDFIFDDKFASDFGWMIVSFNGGGDAVVSGGEVTFTVTKPPSNNKWSFHGSSFENQLTINFSISKIDCEVVNEEYWFSQEEQSALMKWLQKRDGYRWLAFDQNGFEDVWYNAQINPQPHYSNDGRVIGFDLSCVCDSPYGYSQEIEFQKTLGTSNNRYSSIFFDYSDLTGEIHPYTTIEAKGSGTLNVRFGVCSVDGNRNFNSYIYSKDVQVKNVTNGSIITFDENYGLIKGFNDLTNFNFVFPFIGNNDDSNYNIIENLSNFNVEIYMKYRMIRRVYV